MCTLVEYAPSIETPELLRYPDVFVETNTQDQMHSPPEVSLVSIVALEGSMITHDDNSQSTRAEVMSRHDFTPIPDFPEARKSMIPPIIEIENVPFLIEVEDGLVYLSHEQWSLVGYGASLLEAEDNLRHEAKAYLEDLADFPLESYTCEEIELRDFLLRVGV